jgi:hypothetical protein
MPVLYERLGLVLQEKGGRSENLFDDTFAMTPRALASLFPDARKVLRESARARESERESERASERERERARARARGTHMSRTLSLVILAPALTTRWQCHSYLASWF